MSEYQFVYFRAIDEPLTDKDLKYMRTQSTRARITRRSFENEYTFGDFHGDVSKMMRRGYDFHLHYANFGIRSLYFRLPQGLPDSEAAWEYLDDESFVFEKDKIGPGGILSIQPGYEPDALDELWDLERIAIRLSRLRAEILGGDLRPFFLARLALAMDYNHDPEEKVPAVPESLEKLSPPQQTLARFYGIRRSLVIAAARIAKRSDEVTSGTTIVELQTAAKMIASEMAAKKAAAAARAREAASKDGQGAGVIPEKSRQTRRAAQRQSL